MFAYKSFATSLTLLATLAVAKALGPSPGQIKNLVTFGDSYTDVVSDIILNAAFCSVLTKDLQVLAGDNGTSWPIYAARDGNFALHPFARSGATCSNNLTFRPFPSVFESQLPTYFAEVQNGSLRLNPEETVYTLWIGTNDVGVSALLTGGQAPGVTIVDTVSCAVNWIKTLYKSGARNFVFQNVSRVDRYALTNLHMLLCNR